MIWDSKGPPKLQVKGTHTLHFNGMLLADGWCIGEDYFAVVISSISSLNIIYDQAGVFSELNTIVGRIDVPVAGIEY